MGLVAELGQHILQLLDVLQGRGGGDVTAVQEDVAVGLLYAVRLGMAQQGQQMADIGVDVAVGQQAQEVHGLAVLDAVLRQVDPGGRREQRAVLNALAHQLGALGVDLAAAEGVVTHLGVAHVLVRGQADGGAVGLEPGIGAGGEEVVQVGSLGNRHSVAAAAVTLADAVHNHQYNRFFHRNSSSKYFAAN